MKEDVRRLIAAKAVRAVLAETEGPAKVELLAEMRASGTERIRALSDGGEDMGTVSFTKGSVSARVVDEPAFVAWVKANRPSEIVNAVRPAYWNSVMKACKEAGAAVTRDGEVIPGVVVEQGSGHLTVRDTEAARAILRDALGAHLPELAAGDD